MTPEQFERAEKLFDALIDLDDGARLSHLDAECDDAVVREEVIRMLAQDRTLELAPDERRVAAAAVPTIGAEIDRYKLLEQIGEGGFGVVYLAEQKEPVRRRVAVKVIKLGMDTVQVVNRFEAERQALALMDHPNIATVLDGGATETGRPYFVMEYVQGIPITEYCDRHRLSIEDRLRLIIDVCDAVQHAHQKGVIHRDIKPSNVLVGVQGDKPVVKIIDFGIAKATHADLTDSTVFTQQRQLLGTPEYMSPEQAERTGLDIDTRSDIYSIGVLAYKLLTGTTPFDGDRLRSAELGEVQRIIREEEPQKPSTRITTSSDGGTPPGDVRLLTRALRGDLDWITMKAMEKDRTRRYASPSEMAADIGRHLANLPVLAGPPGVGYRLTKFARRNRVAVGFGGTIAVLLVGFAIAMGMQAARIADERDRANDAAAEAEEEAATAQAVTDFLVGLFEASDPTVARGDDPPASEILARGAERIGELADRPQVQAKLLESLGYVYTVQAKYELAIDLYEQALAIRERQGDELAIAKALQRLATSYDTAGRNEEGLPLIERSVAMFESMSDYEQDLCLALNTWANILWRLGDLEQAEAIHRRTLAVRESFFGPDHESVSQSLHNIASLRLMDGDFVEAEKLYLRSLEIENKKDDPDDWGAATTLHTLAIVYENLERYEEAEAYELRSLDTRERVLGPDHPYVALSLTTLGNIYRKTDRSAEAIPHLRRAVEVGTAAWGEDHSEVWWMNRCLAGALIDIGELSEAEMVLQAVFVPTDGAGAEGFAGLTLAMLGDVYRDQERWDDADDHYRRGLAKMANAWGQDDADRVECLRGYADMLRRAGREGDAQQIDAEIASYDADSP